MGRKYKHLTLDIEGIVKLAEFNGIGLSKSKAIEEVGEYLEELESNRCDEMLLDEFADVIVTGLQVLKHKGLLEKLPMAVLRKTAKGMNNYVGDYTKNRLQVKDIKAKV